MPPKRTLKNHRDAQSVGRAVRLVRGSWLHLFVAEVSHRCRLALFAPTIQRSLVIERQRAHAERERMAEEYARGYLQGWHECYAACLETVEESVSGQQDIWAPGELLAGPDFFPTTN